MHLTETRGLPVEEVRACLLQDYVASGARARPMCLAQERLPLGGHVVNPNATDATIATAQKLRGRQDRHGSNLNG